MSGGEMAISAESVKELREKTGAGMLDCKKALESSDGDVAAAMEQLRKAGLASAGKRAGRQTQEGLVEAYIHPGGKIGVLLEVNCETDFVARTDQFKELVRDLAMQVAAAAPLSVSRDELPEDVVAKEKEILMAQASSMNKPENVLEKIVQGKMEKYYSEVALMEQPYVKEPKQKVEDRVKEAIASLGENINVRRFVRFKLGAE
jgi:elongation factor Ts